MTEHPAWELIARNILPVNRIGAVMADDPVDGCALLFGGQNLSTGLSYNDTWEYRNGTWTNLQLTHSPMAQSNQVMTYDDALKSILYVGISAAGKAETWNFSHGQWNELLPSHSPPPRYNSALTYDAADGYAVLFGGTDFVTYTNRNDTWVYANGDWKQITGTMPAARSWEGLTYDASDGYTLMFGGWQVGYLNDTWEYHSGMWIQLSALHAPVPRAGMAFAYDPALGRVILFGGFDGSGNYNDTWQYGNGSWSNLNVARAPLPRQGEAATYFSAGASLLVAGGYSAPNPRFDGWSWEAPRVGVALSAAGADVAEPFAASVTASSSSGSLQYNWSSTSGFLSCAPLNGANVTCVPTGPGPGWVNVTAVDADRASTTVAVPFRVDSDPSAALPVAAPPSGEVGGAVTLSSNFSGGTGNYLLYNWSGLPPGLCTSSDAATVHCFLAAAGSFLVRVRVEDSNGFLSAPSPALAFRVVDGPVAAPPVATPPVAEVGQSLLLETTPSLGSFSYSSYLWSGLSFGSCTGTATAVVSCRANSPGSYAVTVRVNDSTGVLSPPSLPTTVVVYPGLSAGPVSATPERFDVGQSTVLASNVSGGSPSLSYSWGGLPPGCGSSEADTLVCSPTAPGQYLVAFNVTDSLAGGWTVSASPIDIAVNAELSVGKLFFAPNSVTLGGAINLTVIVSGGTAPYSYLFSGLPQGCVTQNTDLYGCRPSATGRFTLSIQVTDAVGESATQSGVLAVAPVPPVPPASPAGPSSLLLYGGAVGGLVVVAAVVLLLGLRRKRGRGPHDAPES